MIIVIDWEVEFVVVKSAQRRVSLSELGVKSFLNIILHFFDRILQNMNHADYWWKRKESEKRWPPPKSGTFWKVATPTHWGAHNSRCAHRKQRTGKLKMRQFTIKEIWYAWITNTYRLSYMFIYVCVLDYTNIYRLTNTYRPETVYVCICTWYVGPRFDEYA